MMAKVVFSVPVQCLVTVDGGAVTEVRFQPLETFPGLGPTATFFDSDDPADTGDAPGIVAAREVVETWAPLLGLPFDVVWES